MHSQISTPRPLGSHTPHWENTGQETCSSQILVALLITAVGIIDVFGIGEAQQERLSGEKDTLKTVGRQKQCPEGGKGGCLAGRFGRFALLSHTYTKDGTVSRLEIVW